MKSPCFSWIQQFLIHQSRSEGYRVLSEDVFDDWYARYTEALGAIEEHDHRLSVLCDEIERDLILIGATAIEDKLQIDVGDTITSLLAAQISVWVLTGDKRETAINIGFACGLISSGIQLVVIDDTDPEEIRRVIDSAKSYNGPEMALVVSGAALTYVLQDPFVDDFYAISRRCRSVVCCRVSPSQKARVVSLIRRRTGTITLAIGDGANDVGMIREADIGVGISGKEGRQAVLASDYSFGEFRFLKRLLLFHGRLCFYRNVELINYAFYKNMVFSFVEMLFRFFCAFTGTSLYHSVLYTIFNVIFTSCPPVVFAALERDVSLEEMMDHPDLYVFEGKRNRMQSMSRFLFSLFLGFCHAIVCFWIPSLGLDPLVDPSGFEIGLEQLGVIVYGCVIVLVTLRLSVMCNHWTGLHFFFFIGSVVIYPGVIAVISFMGFSEELYRTGLQIFLLPGFWFSLIASSLATLLPVLVQRTIKSARGPRVAPRPEPFTPIRPRADVVLPTLPPFPDATNETGAVFDAPAAVASVRFRSRLDSQRFTSRQFPSSARSFASLDIGVLPPAQFSFPLPADEAASAIRTLGRSPASEKSFWP
jgi:phospholipid-translocating P-type ATPase (flippase)